MSGSLFYGQGGGASPHSYEAKIHHEIESRYCKGMSEKDELDLVNSLVEKYKLNAPRVHREKLYQKKSGETKIEVSDHFDYGVARNRRGPHHVPGQYIMVALPFDGDSELFHHQPSTWTSRHPEGLVNDQEVTVVFKDVKLDPQKIRREIDDWVNLIEKYLAWTRSDCEAWNARISDVAVRYIKERKERLHEQVQAIADIGLPTEPPSD